MELTKNDIGKKFKTRDGQVVELRSNRTCTVYPYHVYVAYAGKTDTHFHGLTPNGESCIGDKNIDLVARADEEPKGEKKTPIEAGDAFKLCGTVVHAYQVAYKVFKLFTTGSFNRYIENDFRYVEELVKLGYKPALKLQLGDRVRMSTDEVGKVVSISSTGGTVTRIRVDVSRDGFYFCDQFGESENSSVHITEVLPKQNFLPIGTYIKFVRDSRTGRYKKGELAKVVDHGQKSMCVHKVGSADGIFLPPDRNDIYAVVTV